MNLDDIMTAGSLIINVALGVVVCRNTLSNQENGERIRVFEIMQERGTLPTSRQIQQDIWDEEAEATKQIEQAARQKALPAPRREQRRPQKNVIKSPAGYNPDEESYVDDTQPFITRRKAAQPARTTDTARTVRTPYGQRRHYGYVHEDEQ